MGHLCNTYYSFKIFIKSGADGAFSAPGSLLEPGTNTFNYVVYGIIMGILIILGMIMLYRNLVKTRKILVEKEQTLDLLARQNVELENREKNLTDSLVYAQRIQEALLPSEEYFRKHFRDSFIFFKPKDIVSGDFFWIEEKNEKVFIVAADCTGHGVPGALMSVIGLEIIGKTINEENIEDPSQILDILNRGLEKTFNRQKNIGTIIRDGMDIGLCVFDRKKKKINYSGAFFPLYLVRDDTLIEIKGDKLIIGMNPSGIPYSNNEIDLKDDDILYIFSDGYVDQFGGIENKKFMYRRFRYLLMTIHKFPFVDQKTILEDNLIKWMMGNKQIDDIMVIGFKPLGAKVR